MKVSMLIGSGFSIPFGMPGVWDLNKKLSAVKEEDIIIHTDMSAFFLEGQEDPNRHANLEERLFLQDFIKFYNDEILTDGEDFHYETFYDFYSDYRREIGNIEVIDEFVVSFEKRYRIEDDRRKSGAIYLDQFNRSFNQLIAQQLSRPELYQDISQIGFPPYNAFLAILKHMAEIGWEVDIHTLNHDMLLDFLGAHESGIFQYFSDGFERAGSQYYGRISQRLSGIKKDYFVKLRSYTGRYDKLIKFYKLHGSIDYVKIIDRASNSWKHVKNDWAIQQFFAELPDTDGNIHFAKVWDQPDPDFLSGTIEKTRKYGEESLYVELFDRFIGNLEASQILVVIGYGFKDPGINEKIDRHFLAHGGKLVVIDPCRPQSNLLGDGHFEFIEKSISDVNHDELRNVLELPELPSTSVY